MSTRQSLPSRILATLLILFPLLFQIGCATQKPPPLDLHLKMQTRKIALLPASKHPDGSLELFAKNRFEGGVAGAIQATPKEEAQRIEKMIRDSLDDFSGQLDLGKLVLAEVGRREGQPIELLPTTVPVSEEGGPDCQWLQAQGFQSVLTITLTKIGFFGEEGPAPPWTFP